MAKKQLETWLSEEKHPLRVLCQCLYGHMIDEDYGDVLKPIPPEYCFKVCHLTKICQAASWLCFEKLKTVEFGKAVRSASSKYVR